MPRRRSVATAAPKVALGCKKCAQCAMTGLVFDDDGEMQRCDACGGEVWIELDPKGHAIPPRDRPHPALRGANL